MTCPDAMKLMAYLDGELDPSEAESVRLHLLECPECARRLEDQGRLESVWRESWRDPPDFRFRAMRESVDRGARKPRGVPGWLIGAAAGAGAVFLGIRVFLGPGHGDLEERIYRETAPSAVQDTAGEQVEESVLEIPADSADAGQPMAVTRTAEPAEVPLNAAGEYAGEPADGGPADQHPAGRALGGLDAVFEQAEETGQTQGLVTGLDETLGSGYCRDTQAEDLEQEAVEEAPAPVQGSLGEGDYDAVLDIAIIAAESGAGGGGMSGASFATASSSMAEEQSDDNGGLSRVRAAKSFILSCTGPGGVDVQPWDLLTSFVDSLLQTRGWIPPVFHLDSLGFTVEREGIPRVDLGVDDPSVVPMTVRVSTF